MASDKHNLTNDEHHMPRNTLDIIIDMVQACRHEHRSLYLDSSMNVQACSDESESMSGESSEDEIDDRHDENKVETMKDLHDELAKLEISEEATTLETLILIVEFYVKSDDKEGFEKNVRKPDKFLLTKPRPRIIDLERMATNMVKQNLPFRAVMLHKAIATTFKYEYDRHHAGMHQSQSDMITPDNAISGILQSIGKVYDSYKLLLPEDETNLYLKHFIPIMYDMLTNLREIRHVNRKLRADREAWGLLFIALIHGILYEFTEMHDVIKSSINLCEKRLKKNTQKHTVHGISLLVLAGVEVLLHKQEAETTVALGIKSLQQSTEFTTWDGKVKVIAKAKEFSIAIGVQSSV